jgi:hypothetical protein
MKSNVYCRGLPPQSLHATSQLAGMTAKSTRISALCRWPPGGSSRRT